MSHTIGGGLNNACKEKLINGNHPVSIQKVAIIIRIVTADF